MDDLQSSIYSEDARIDTLVIAHWNIGHFSLGKSYNTTIEENEVQIKIKEYRSFLDSIDATMIGICEYEPTFALSGEETQSVLFEPYLFRSIGHKYSYNCNALFSTVPINSSYLHFFPESVQSRYYLESYLTINGEEVIFVETHLDWNEGANGAFFRKKQISVLVDKYSNHHHVILCGDFNVSQESEYSPFLQAGFLIANTGDYGVFNTYPAENPTQAIDNIIVRGFSINCVDAVRDEGLSDHSLLKAMLVFQ